MDGISTCAISATGKYLEECGQEVDAASLSTIQECAITITGVLTMPFTLIDDTVVGVQLRTSARLKRAYLTTRRMARRVQEAAESLGMVTALYETSRGWTVFWAPDWEDFWPA